MSNSSGLSLGNSRLLLVSNRLPITIRRSRSGNYEFSMSSGGLVTGLSGLSKTTTFQWYGWPGLEVPEDEIKTVTERLQEEFNATPVFMEDKLADRHYNGFSSTLYMGQDDYPQQTSLIRLVRLHSVAPAALPSW